MYLPADTTATGEQQPGYSAAACICAEPATGELFGGAVMQPVNIARVHAHL
jgi:hypothetical protein